MREVNATKQKMVIAGLIGVFILAMVMIGVMFLGGKKNKKQVVNNETPTQVNTKKSDDGNIQRQTEKNENKKFLKLATNDIYGLKMKEETNQVMFYQQQKILSASPFDGQKHAVENYPFGKVTEFLWSVNSAKAIVKDSGDYYVYDINSNLTNKFRYKIDNAIWNEDGDKVIYKFYNPESNQRKIMIADTTGENRETIVNKVAYRQINMNLWPGNEGVCYFPRPDARVKGKLFCSAPKTKNKKEYGGQYGQDYLWSPNGSKILTSFTREKSGNKLVLGVMNKDGGEARGLAFATTVKKCVWSKNNVDVYCAALGGEPLAIMLPNAWREQIFNSMDTFWKINTETGEKKRLVELSDIDFVVDSENLILDTEESFLFFIDRRSRDLWRLKL